MRAAVVSLLEHPRGKRAVVVGGGKTGAAATALLVRLGADVTIVDDAALEPLRAGLAKGGLDFDAATANGVRVRAGGIDPALLAGADVILLSPGVPRAHAAVAPALAAGVPCVNEVELAAAHLPGVRVIGITGTNGKSTTTTMCGAIASAHDKGAFVGGNLGTPYCCAVLDGMDPKIAVLELSSYQLETINHLPLCAAVVTNLSPDHLDRYPSPNAYYAAKARIFSLVDARGGIALNAADAESRTHLEARVPGARARCDFDISSGLEGIAIRGAALDVRPPGSRGAVTHEVGLTNQRIIGHHNRQNAAAAVAAALLAQITRDAWQLGIDAYAGIAHRLERVGERGGVVWFNDSKGTNVDATVTAVKSFAGGIHLIAGGLGKGSSYAPLVEVSRGKVVAVYTIGSDAPLIAAAYAAAGGVADVVDCQTLDVACARANARAHAGEIVLLSPACASFDQFRDYAHRGEAFRALFASLASSSQEPR